MLQKRKQLGPSSSLTCATRSSATSVNFLNTSPDTPTPGGGPSSLNGGLPDPFDPGNNAVPIAEKIRRRVTTIDETGAYTQVYLNGFDLPVMNRQVVSSPLTFLETKTTYDGLGRVVETYTPEGRPSAYGYNRLGQLISSVSPDLDGNANGDPTDEILSSGTPDVQTVYDDAGRPRFVVDPVRRAAGQQAYMTYDGFGRVREEGLFSSAGSALTDPAKINSASWPVLGTGLERTEYQYDTAAPTLPRVGLTITNPSGRLVQTRFFSASATAPNTGYVHYSYDNQGRIEGYHINLAGLGDKLVRY